jgi:hypothetical protein
MGIKANCFTAKHGSGVSGVAFVAFEDACLAFESVGLFDAGIFWAGQVSKRLYLSLSAV